MNGITFQVAWKACKASWCTGHPGQEGLGKWFRKAIFWFRKAIFFFLEAGKERKEDDGVYLCVL